MSAADDAAGLAISEDFKAKVSSLDQAIRNANDGVSVIQTAEGSMKRVGDMLNRMRELAVQSATGTNTSAQRSYLNNEFRELVSEIDRIANTTEFNSQLLLNGAQAGGMSFQVGADTVTGNELTLSIATTNASALSIGGSSITTDSLAKTTISKLDSAISQLSSRRSTIGAMQNRLQVTISNLDNYRTNLSAANSRIVDIDVANETANLTKQQILVQAGTSMLAQANSSPQMALSLIG
jgi:flagellin